MDVARVLAGRLQARRLELGWSRVTLGERAAVSPATLREFERSGQVSLRRLVRLADAQADEAMCRIAGIGSAIRGT